MKSHGQDGPLRTIGVVAWMDKQFLTDLPSRPKIQAHNEMNICAVLWGAKTFTFSSVDKGGKAILRKSIRQDHKMNTQLVSVYDWLQSSLVVARFYSPCHRLSWKPSTAVSASSHPSDDFPNCRYSVYHSSVTSLAFRMKHQLLRPQTGMHSTYCLFHLLSRTILS